MFLEFVLLKKRLEAPPLQTILFVWDTKKNGQLHVGPIFVDWAP